MPTNQFYIVDDDESVGRALGMLLGAYGYKSRAFACAEDFLEAVPAGTPGCLLLDIHLPGLSGWETLHQVLASGSRRPVILISGDEDGALMSRAYKAGAAGFLQKPFQDKALFDMISVVY